MKNILLVFTGGTIGSQCDNGVIDTDTQAGFKLIQLFRQGFAQQQEIAFKTLQPLQILSENLHPQAWKNIIAAIEGEDLRQFDGIIITHGTDTLAFSAALLAVYFQQLDIPLLLVSSDLPLDNPQANGVKNFMCAVDFIRQQVATGIYVPYQNPGQTLHIHHAARLSCCLPLSSDFISVQSKHCMEYQHGQFSILYQPATRVAAQTTLQATFGRILLIRPYPGLDYSYVNLEGIDAVLHDLYHSGTACVSEQWGDQHSLLAFSQRCRHSNIPLYLAPALYSKDAYSSTRDLLAYGAQMLWNTSLETAYAKLLLAYGNYDQPAQRADFLATELSGEQN